MNVNSIINMILRIIMRKGINAGINKGMHAMRGGGGNQSRGRANQAAPQQMMSPEEQADFDELKRQKKEARRAENKAKHKQQNTIERM